MKGRVATGSGRGRHFAQLDWARYAPARIELIAPVGIPEAQGVEDGDSLSLEIRS